MEEDDGDGGDGDGDGERTEIINNDDDDDDDNDDEVELLASSLGLSRKLDARVAELSGGQCRATSLATALVGGGGRSGANGNGRGGEGGGRKRDFSSLLLDEPTAGLDATARRAAWRAIQGSRRGVLLCTHALEEADAAASRAVVVARGKVVACGTPEQLRELAGGGCVLTVSFSQNPSSSASSSSPLERVEREVLSAVPLARRGGDSFADSEEDFSSSSSPSSPSSVSFRLPDSSSSRFPALLRSLDKKRQQLGISGIGMSVVPLEEAVAALVAGGGGGGGERAEEEGEDAGALPPPPSSSSLPPPLPTTATSPSPSPPPPPRPRLSGPRLALSRLSALLGRQLTTARRRWRREALDAFSSVAAVAFAAWLAGSGGGGAFGGNGDGTSPSVAHPPAPLSRSVALGGMPAALGASLTARGSNTKAGGDDASGTLVRNFAEALGPPTARDTGATCLWPEADSKGGRTLDDLLLESWYRGDERKKKNVSFDAAFVERWSDAGNSKSPLPRLVGRFPSTVTLLANGSAPAALPAALAAAAGAAREMMMTNGSLQRSKSLTLSSPPLPPPGIEALDPGPTAAASRVGSLVGSWLLALQLSSTVSFAAAAAARRVASERGGGGEEAAGAACFLCCV